MPSELTVFRFGDIVLVPFPFTDQTTVKRRPAAVISALVYNSEKPDLVVMAVTSQLRPVTSLGERLDSGLVRSGSVEAVSHQISDRHA